MAVAVTNVGTANNNNASSISVSVPVGGVPTAATIIVCVAETGNNAFTMTTGQLSDSVGNSYSVQQTAFTPEGSDKESIGIFYSPNCLALVSGNTVKYTCHASSSAEYAISVFYATGLISAPYDAAVTSLATNQSFSGSGAFSAALVSGVPAAAGELMVAAVATETPGGGTVTYTQSAGGWATPPVATQFNNSGFSTFIGGGTLINSGVGTVSFSPTLGSHATGNYGAIILGFKSIRPFAQSSQMIF